MPPHSPSGTPISDLDPKIRAAMLSRLLRPVLRDAASHLPYADLVVPVVERMLRSCLGPPVQSVTREIIVEAVGPDDPNAALLIPLLEFAFLKPEPPSPSEASAPACGAADAM